MIIDSQRSWVEIFRTSSCLLCMKNQLLENPVIVRLLNVCIPNFPVSHHLPRKVAFTTVANFFVVYYESIKRELKRRLIYE